MTPLVYQFDAKTTVDCEQSLFCSKIRGEKDAEHESRARSEAGVLLAASPLARDSCSATFPPRIFEQKGDCSQSKTTVKLLKNLRLKHH